MASKKAPKATNYNEALSLAYGLQEKTLQNVSVARFDESPDPTATQLRASTDRPDRVAMIKSMAEHLKAGGATPPVLAVMIANPGGKNYLQLISGFARRQAHIDANRPMIPAHVLPGTYTIDEAVALAAGSNNEHGTKVTNEDKRYAIFRVLSRSNIKRTLVEGSDTIYTGTLPNGEPFTTRAAADLTGTGSASVSHMTISNILARKSAPFQHMLDFTEDGSAVWTDPRTYDPTKARAAKATKTARKDAATAAKRAAEDAAAASAAADTIATKKDASDADVDAAARAAAEANKAAKAAAEAHAAAVKARDPEAVKKLAAEAKAAADKAHAAAQGSADDDADELPEIKPTSKAGSRAGHFTIYPRDADATANDILRAVVEAMDSGPDRVAFLGRLSDALAATFAPYIIDEPAA